MNMIIRDLKAKTRRIIFEIKNKTNMMCQEYVIYIVV